MIILVDRKLVEAKFKNEQEIEEVVIANSEHFFGPSSVLVVDPVQSVHRPGHVFGGAIVDLPAVGITTEAGGGKAGPEAVGRQPLDRPSVVGFDPLARGDVKAAVAPVGAGNESARQFLKQYGRNP